jgi:hypothetical protein
MENNSRPHLEPGQVELLTFNGQFEVVNRDALPLGSVIDGAGRLGHELDMGDGNIIFVHGAPPSREVTL